MRAIVCHNIRSLHNVGAVLRTADAAGWGHVHMTGYTGCPPDRRIEKVSLGAEEALHWEQHDDGAAWIRQLQHDGWYIVGLEQTDDAVDIFTFDAAAHSKLALVLGNEVTGIEDEILDLCDSVVEIPMHGVKQSLNVSVASGVAMYALGE